MVYSNPPSGCPVTTSRIPQVLRCQRIPTYTNRPRQVKQYGGRAAERNDMNDFGPWDD